MGGLLAFRVDNYNNTAEREQFRFLCEQLKAHYENSGEFCVFVGNYNIGCELDGLFIKKDAIIVIEFKNYGGMIVANENGAWTCDGKNIKGGSRKTVLQQARINHSTVKKELKGLGVSKENIKDIPTLIIFNQPIQITNNLSGTNKSWLHITDNQHFLEKLDDITCPNTDLDPLGIVNLAELLNLNSFFLAEFSNAVFSKPFNPIERKDFFKDTEEYDFFNQNSELAKSHNEEDFKQTLALNNKQEALEFETPDILIPLRNFAEQIVSMVWRRHNFNVFAINHKDFSSLYSRFASYVKQENIIIITGPFTEDERLHLAKFLKEDVFTISNNALFWQYGEYIGGSIYEPFILEDNSDANKNCCKKSSSNLPSWLDKYIYDILGGNYSPDHVKYEYNLELDRSEVLVYLGTYFPRSYYEIYSLFSSLLSNSNYNELMVTKKNVSFLDLGCGTGGDILGLLSFIEEFMPSVESVKILAIDGNQNALRIFQNVLAQYKKYSRLKIEENIGPAYIEEENDLNILSEVVSDNFDFVISCKAICEMLAKGRINNKAYKKIAGILAKKLSPTGILLIEDVTVKIDTVNEFIPVVLNRELNEFIRDTPEFSTLAPFCCKRNGLECKGGCFFKKEFVLSHSRKTNDLSKIVYRFISRKQFADSLCINNVELDNKKCKMY